MPGELYQIYANKKAINKKRTALKLSDLNTGGYWSSREGSSSIESDVRLINGSFSFNSKVNLNYVLGFLALQV